MPESAKIHSDFDKLTEEISRRPPSMWAFKSNKEFRKILEHVSPSQGRKYIQAINMYFPGYLELNHERVVQAINANDMYGKTLKSQFGAWGNMSPSNWRYILHALLVLKHAKDTMGASCRIIEIGGGYGGLSVFIHLLSTSMGVEITNYTILDLPSVSKLQKLYLGACGLQEVVCTALQNFRARGRKDSFFVSCYAFSELAPAGGDVGWRKAYREKVLDPDVKHGFLAWNGAGYGVPVYNFMEGISITQTEENPQTGSCNRYITF